MRTEELSSPPSLTTLLVKAILTAPTRRGGDLPDTELVLSDVVADAEKLANYARVCGFRLGSDLPPTYPHILGFPLAMRLMTDSGFPFALPGLVHASNLIVQHRTLPADRPLSIRVRAEGLEPTDKGTQFVMRTEAYAGDTAVWQEESRYLHLEKSKAADKPRLVGAPEPQIPTAIWRLGDDLGRRYAAVSGDHNPIHLHPVSAKLAGFSKPIAHGMWTLAHCLAALEGRLADAYRAEVRFRRPISLPSTVGFRAQPTGDGWEFGVHNRSGEKTYVTGTVGAP
ncbi:MAG: MaoC/PaaZ C-terminal domain-containing protein [Micromonosporaceae bacterium]